MPIPLTAGLLNWNDIPKLHYRIFLVIFAHVFIVLVQFLREKNPKFSLQTLFEMKI